jgi:hydrogenase expression/formation protein HypC
MCLAVPLKLLEISTDRREGTVALAGSTIRVGLELISDAKPGDFVLVHAGMAIEKVQEAEAEETLELYREYAHLPGLLAPKPKDTHG